MVKHGRLILHCVQDDKGFLVLVPHLKTALIVGEGEVVKLGPSHIFLIFLTGGAGVLP
jgi:hypothetical protein